ncbi:MAG: hypothetical protein LQ338_003061 [Usnochroma carphineum]|nr:MAG: hypothetical protein LQ338_003061 [Usnochroma carphineum]
MAARSSLLPTNTGGHESARPFRARLNTVSASDALNTPYGPQDNLRQRQRATTDAASVVPGNLFDRRFKSGSQRQPPPTVPHLEDLRIGDDSSKSPEDRAPYSQLSSINTSLLDEHPSAPITIPSRKSPSSRPITPLTGREPSFFVHSAKQSHTPPQRTTSKDFTPSPDSRSQSSQSEQEPFAHSPFTRRSMKPDRGGASPMYRPSSPLSPTMATYSTSPLSQHRTRAQSGNTRSQVLPGPLAIPSLPPFHPANYESRNSSPRSSRPTSSSHGRQLSDAQKKILKNQRELVINATRTAAAKSPLPRPTSPRLNPLGSPGPVTPLMLEGQSDYFLAGPGTTSSSARKDTEGREILERLIAAEKDSMARAERADRHSPAVSPAGGPG